MAEENDQNSTNGKKSPNISALVALITSLGLNPTEVILNLIYDLVESTDVKPNDIILGLLSKDGNINELNGNVNVLISTIVNSNVVDNKRKWMEDLIQMLQSTIARNADKLDALDADRVKESEVEPEVIPDERIDPVEEPITPPIEFKKVQKLLMTSAITKDAIITKKSLVETICINLAYHMNPAFNIANFKQDQIFKVKLSKTERSDLMAEEFNFVVGNTVVFLNLDCPGMLIEAAKQYIKDVVLTIDESLNDLGITIKDSKYNRISSITIPVAQIGAPSESVVIKLIS